MTILIIGVIIFLAITVYNRFITEKAMGMLSNEQKGELLNRFASVRKWNIVLLAGIILAFLGLSEFTQMTQTPLMIGYFAALLIYTVATGYISYQTQLKLDFPKEYFAKIRITLLLRTISLIILVVALTMFLKEKQML